MARDRAKGRGGNRRAVRPTLDGRLDPRVLPAASPWSYYLHYLRANQPLPSVTAFGNLPSSRRPPIHRQTANGGMATIVRDSDGELYNVFVENGGTVRAVPSYNGQVNLIVEGTSTDSNLVIEGRTQGVQTSKVPASRRLAHDFSHKLATGDKVLHINSIDVVSGTINQILGYQTAEVSGPITVSGSTPVDRIALASLDPGASIQVGGSLNTLDIYRSANLDGGPGIVVGQDLNWMEIGQDLTLNNGAQLNVGRDLGLLAQAAKGTGAGGQGASIGSNGGNFTIGPGSSFVIGRALDAPFIVYGNLNEPGATSITDRISIPEVRGSGSFQVLGNTP